MVMKQTLEVIKTEMQDVTGDLLERRVAGALAPALGAGAAETVVRDDHEVLSWRRVEVADGIELHVQRPLAREQRRRLDKLLLASREIFEEEPL